MKLRPYQAPRRQPNINDMIYPKGSRQPGNVWVAGVVMNVPEPSGESINPSDISGLFAWYDLQDTTTITTSGINLLSVNDKSPNGYTLQNPVGSVQYKLSTITNFTTKMVAYYSGASNMSASLPSLSPPSGSTMFAVFGKKTVNSSPLQISSGTTLTTFATNQIAIHNLNTNVRIVLNGKQEVISCSLSIGDSVIVGASGNFNGLTDKITEKTGISCSTISQTGTGTTTNTLTNLRSGTTGTGEVEILEIMVYDRILTNSEFTTILDYLENKYGYSSWV